MKGSVSLSKMFGLKADSIICDQTGAPHQVNDADLLHASKVGGGSVLCVACGGVIQLRKASS